MKGETRLVRCLQILQFIALTQIEGCIYWMNLPRPPKSLRFKQLDRNGDVLTIVCEYIHSRTAKKDNLEQTTIELNTTTRRFNHDSAHGWLLNKDYQGVGPGMARLMSIPSALLISPIIILINLAYRLSERKHGMSRHGIALFKRIGESLDKETRALLENALRAEWELDVFLRSKPSFEEARELLIGCHCNCYKEGDFMRAAWHHPLRKVRVAHLDTLEPKFQNGGIQVLGTFFRGLEGCVLRDTYSTISVITPKTIKKRFSL